MSNNYNKKKGNGQRQGNAGTSAGNHNVSTNTEKETKESEETVKIQKEEIKETVSEQAVVDNKKTEHEKTDNAEKKQIENKAATWQDNLKNSEYVKTIKNAISAKNIKVIVISALKILLPVAAFVIVIATIISLVNTKKGKEAEKAAGFTEASTEQAASAVLSEPLQENAYPEVNSMVNSFYQALADGDMDTIKSIKDYTNDKEIITFQKKSEYIESYHNITCYTKEGIEPNTYYLYVYYEVKFKDIDTMAPGLNAWYVYTNADGVLQIDGDMEESVTAALKLVTSQDDVVDLYNKVDVSYKEAIASDEALNTFLAEFPNEIKTSVGVALAQLEEQNSEEQTTESAETQTAEQESEAAQETTQTEEPQTQTVNQQVRATDTVNVRSSDSEEADKIGKAQQGDVLTRVEEKINGWSKVIYDGKEAYIKSDYLEVISTDTESSGNLGTVKAKTNVNVRNAASQNAEKIGVAQGEESFKLLEDQGEWLKIDYNGQTGYVKAEYFE